MTYHQQTLLEDAKDMWSRGFRIPLDLYAALAAEGFDVPALEAKHFNDKE